MSEASPHGDVDQKFRSRACPYAIYMGRTFIPGGFESASKNFTDSTKGNGRLEKPAIRTLDLSMMKKNTADSKATGKKRGLHAACLVNSYQGKDGGVFSD